LKFLSIVDKLLASRSEYVDQALQLVWSDDGQLQRSPYSLTPPLTPPLKHSFVGEIFRIALPRTTGSASPHLPFGLCIEPDRENVNARRLSWLAGWQAGKGGMDNDS